MFVLQANKTQLNVSEKEQLTSGSKSIYNVRFEFSNDWASLTKTAVFRYGEQAISVPLDADGECTIPSEVLRSYGRPLFAGVYGTSGENIVLPTIWANLGTVKEGASPNDETNVPDLNQLQQALTKKGDRLDYTEAGQLGLYSGDKLLSEVPIKGGGAGPAWGIGHGLKLENGDLTVATTDDFSGDNTLPMTAAGVETVVGNIEALLGTI